MTTIDDIQRLARDYAQRRNTLAERAQQLNEEVERIKRQHLARVRSAARSAADAKKRLEANVAANPHLFERPRTLVMSGIRVGFVKGKGQLIIEDPARVVELIRKRLPEQAAALIAVRETPVKKALANLSVTELKRIGVTLQEAGDQVVVKPTDGEIDKLVAALLKDADRLAEDAA